MIALRLVVFSLFFSLIGLGQSLKGRVIDNETKDGIPFATIQFVESETHYQSDSLGYFNILIISISYFLLTNGAMELFI